MTIRLIRAEANPLAQERVRSVSANTTLTPEDAVVITTGTITVTLPKVAAVPGHAVRIKKSDSLLTTLTVAAAGGDSFDFGGGASLTLTALNAKADLVSDGGTTWLVFI